MPWTMLPSIVLLQAVRVDDLAAVVRDGELARPDLAGRRSTSTSATMATRGAVALRVGDAAAREHCLPVWLRRGDGRGFQPDFSAAALITAMSRGSLT